MRGLPFAVVSDAINSITSHLRVLLHRASCTHIIYFNVPV